MVNNSAENKNKEGILDKLDETYLHSLQLELFKNEYIEKIKNLNNDLNKKLIALQHSEADLILTKDKLACLNLDYKKIKKESKYQLKQRDERLQAYEKINNSKKLKYEEDRKLLQNRVFTLEKTIEKLKSENEEILKQNILNLQIIDQLSAETSSNKVVNDLKDSYETCLIEKEIVEQQLIRSIITNKSDHLTTHANNDFLTKLETLKNENLELQRKNVLLKDLTDKNYLIVNENENLRNRLKTYEEICHHTYPLAQKNLEILGNELKEWRNVANLLLLNSKSGDSCPQLCPKIVEGDEMRIENFSFALRELVKENDVVKINNERYQKRVKTLSDKLESQESLIQTANVDLDVSKLHLKTLLTTLKYFRDNLKKIQPKSGKLQHFLECRSIIPRGHSEYENFKDTFLIIDNMINFPLSNEEK